MGKALELKFHPVPSIKYYTINLMSIRELDKKRNYPLLKYTLILIFTSNGLFAVYTRIFMHACSSCDYLHIGCP